MLNGALHMLCAALLFTVMSVTVKLLPPHYTVWHIGFIRCMGGFLLLPAFFGLPRTLFGAQRLKLLIFRGFTGTLAFVSAVSALRIMPISTSTVIFYSFPVFAALFSALIYKERLNRAQVCCVLLVFTGVAVLFDFELTGSFWGYFLALSGGFFAGLTVTLIRSLRENHGPVVIYFYFCLVGSAATFPFFISHPVWPGTMLEFLMIATIILSSIGAQLMMNQGFYYCRSWEGSVYMSMETVFTAFIGIVMLHDPVSWRFFCGAVLIILSGLFLSRLSRQQ